VTAKSTHSPQQERRKTKGRYLDQTVPQALTGQNIGRYSVDEDPEVRYASDIKKVTKILSDFSMSELRQIPIVPKGRMLKQGAVYLDLKDPYRRPFMADGYLLVDEKHHFVPKAETAYIHWNKLIGIRAPDRIQ
jgi:hypothetical protein